MLDAHGAGFGETEVRRLEHAITLRLAGESGRDNVNSAGEVLARACARAGLEVFTYKTFPAEIKGGHVIYQLRVAGQPLHAAGDRLDALVAFNAEAVRRHGDLLRPGGLLIYDPDEAPDPLGALPAGAPRPRLYAAPFARLAKEGGARKNVVAVGLVGGLLGLDPDLVADVVAGRYAHRPEAMAANRRALAIGRAYADAHPVALRDRAADAGLPTAPRAPAPPLAPPPAVSPPAARPRRLILTGNQALAFGAIAGGCRAFFGYPITPASDILETLAATLPALGGTVVQAEDEMAALAAAIGAAYAGAPAMTATSGPGLSLMVELVGLAVMTETPVVIVDVMRAGPSTGMPTKTEQADLSLAALGGHGEAPRVVLAAADVADCFRQAARAVQVAERFQVPVILLSDMSLSNRVQAVDRPDPESLRLLAAPSSAAAPAPPTPSGGAADPARAGEQPYLRYRLTPDGISPRALPGQPDRRFLATGLEHDERGFPNYAPSNHAAMMDKRRRKLEGVAAAIPAATLHAPEGFEHCDLGVITWGSSTGPVREAAGLLRQEGLSVDVLQAHLLWPPPAEALRAFARRAGRLAVAELNASGQFAALLRAELGIEAARINKSDGTPFLVEELASRLRALASAAAPADARAGARAAAPAEVGRGG